MFVQKSWEFVQGVLDAWKNRGSAPLAEYPAGSWGPAAAEDLIRADGRTWHEP